MGLVSGAAGTATKGTVVVFHGNAGVAPYRWHYVEALERLGYRVVLAEYPGYGGRGGWLTERSLVADGVRVARRAKEEFGSPLYLWGESMGAGVAAGVARETGLEADGVVMMTPWDSLENMARMLFPSFLVRVLLRDPYDNVNNLSGFTGPVAIIVAEHDEVIPSLRGLRLHEVLAGQKRLWMLKGCGHNNWPDRIEPGFWSDIMDYVSRPAKQGP